MKKQYLKEAIKDVLLNENASNLATAFDQCYMVFHNAEKQFGDALLKLQKAVKNEKDAAVFEVANEYLQEAMKLWQRLNWDGKSDYRELRYQLNTGTNALRKMK